VTPSAADHESVEGDGPVQARRAREDLERFFAFSRDLLCVADFDASSRV
jgi:hypothetical protein